MGLIETVFATLSTVFWADPWAQLLGLLALIIGVSAFLHKSDYLLRRNLTIYTLLMGCQFMLLGHWSSAITAWLGTLRTYISMRTRNIWVMCGFLLIVFVTAFPNAHTLIEYLPILGTSFGTWAMFRETGLRMRTLMLLGTVCWLTHNFFIGSIGGTIIEAIFLGVNGRTMFTLMQLQKSTDTG